MENIDMNIQSNSEAGEAAPTENLSGPYVLNLEDFDPANKEALQEKAKLMVATAMGETVAVSQELSAEHMEAFGSEVFAEHEASSAAIFRELEAMVSMMELINSAESIDLSKEDPEVASTVVAIASEVSLMQHDAEKGEVSAKPASVATAMANSLFAEDEGVFAKVAQVGKWAQANASKIMAAGLVGVAGLSYAQNSEARGLKDIAVNRTIEQAQIESGAATRSEQHNARIAERKERIELSIENAHRRLETSINKMISDKNRSNELRLSKTSSQAEYDKLKLQLDIEWKTLEARVQNLRDRQEDADFRMRSELDAAVRNVKNQEQVNVRAQQSQADTNAEIGVIREKPEVGLVVPILREVLKAYPPRP